MSTLISELQAQSITQWVALITGITYVVLASRENPLCWVFGIISCLCIAWDDFTSFKLYADGVLQILYVGLGFLGLYQWLYGRYEDENLVIHELPLRQHVMAIALAAVVSIPVYYILTNYTDARYGYLDTLTTVLSLYATWLLTRKVHSNWLYWIVIDSIYVFIFFRTGGKLVALLYLVFTVVAIYGYFHWGRKRGAGFANQERV